MWAMMLIHLLQPVPAMKLQLHAVLAAKTLSVTMHCLCAFLDSSASLALPKQELTMQPTISGGPC